MTISLDKKYMTRDGRRVRLIAACESDKRTVKGYIKGNTIMGEWSCSGKYLFDETGNRDLVELETMNIETSKVYKCLYGGVVNFIAEDTYYVVGHFGDGRLGMWVKDTGGWALDEQRSDLRLVEVKPRIRLERWANIKPRDDGGLFVNTFVSREVADQYADKFRIACVKIEIDCEEGEGL